jgi:hypothetical protein
MRHPAKKMSCESGRFGESLIDGSRWDIGGSGKFSHGSKRLFVEGCQDSPFRIFNLRRIWFRVESQCRSADLSLAKVMD